LASLSQFLKSGQIIETIADDPIIYFQKMQEKSLAYAKNFSAEVRKATNHCWDQSNNRASQLLLENFCDKIAVEEVFLSVVQQSFFVIFLFATFQKQQKTVA